MVMTHIKPDYLNTRFCDVRFHFLWSTLYCASTIKYGFYKHSHLIQPKNEQIHAKVKLECGKFDGVFPNRNILIVQWLDKWKLKASTLPYNTSLIHSPRN